MGTFVVVNNETIKRRINFCCLTGPGHEDRNLNSNETATKSDIPAYKVLILQKILS